MASSPNPTPTRWFPTLLWGNSVALSWMWGLGLFFSVQFSTQFGLFGLLIFAITNGLGLLCFGLVTHHIARREPGSESLARFFTTWSRPFRLVFFLYQLLAITLTIFAFIRYGWLSLGMQPWLLYLPLTLLIVLAAAILFGEEFDIKRIKYSHGVLGLILAAAVAVLIINAIQSGPVTAQGQPKMLAPDWNFWGYVIPIIIGFLVGPWLDLQQWQRAIQMHRERVSIAAAYWVGSIQFTLMLIFHGTMTLWALGHGASQYLRQGVGNYTYGHETLVLQFFEHASPWVFGAYAVWICVCVLTTLDSGYISLRWFLQDNAALSNNPLFALIPKRLITSPIPIFIFAGVIALIAAVLKMELEYFMIFYATFFVGYSVLSIARCYVITPANAIPQVKMFCIGSLAVVIFAYGYFLRLPLFQIIGSLLPLAYVVWLLFKPGSPQEFVSDSEELSAPSQDIGPATAPALAPAATADAPALPGSHPVGGHFEGKWFVHSFVATYADTNSVGNVYFGMYAMWVGKTRELFFNQVMPKFDLKNTPFYILTRSFEHKFVRETREFETVSVRIRIASYNRKFVILEHEIYDSAQKLLGHGKQSLLFVASTDYKLIDLPAEVTSAFMVYT
ncbi:MAG: acyl-CoA thioesterase [Verrucomicrobia bacterium]|nr:acyl-CoA thioesterase [Verrucomicrobiota bacterium]